MKKNLILISLFLSIFIHIAYAATPPLQVFQGGTGWGNIQAKSIPYGNGTGRLATTSQGTGGQGLFWLNGIPSWAATTTFSTGITYLAGNVTCNTASGTVFGCLSSADWTTFNNKVSFAWPFTTATNGVGVSTSTLLNFVQGFISLASSTAQDFNSASSTIGVLLNTRGTSTDFVITRASTTVLSFGFATGTTAQIGNNNFNQSTIGINGSANAGGYNAGVLSINGTAGAAGVLEMIRPITSSNSVVASFTAGDTSNSTLAGVDFRSDTANNLGAVVFKTSAGSSPLERLRVDSSGKVGIGTTTIWGKLSIHGSKADDGTPLFVIASSTDTSTTTFLTVDKNGLTSMTNSTSTLGTVTTLFFTTATGTSASTTNLATRYFGFDFATGTSATTTNLNVGDQITGQRETFTNSTSTNFTASTQASTSQLTVSNAVRFLSLATGILHSTAGVISSSLVNLTSATDITGVLPLANGGTNRSSISASNVLALDGTSIGASSTPVGQYFIATSTAQGSTFPLINFTQATGTNIFTSASSTIQALKTTILDILDTGVRLTATDGALTFLGLGNGNDEDTKFDFDNAAANSVDITSSTGVTWWNWGTIGLSSLASSTFQKLFSTQVGIGTTSPWSMLTIQKNDVDFSPIFAIASSTNAAGTASTTIFEVNRDQFWGKNNARVAIGTSTATNTAAQTTQFYVQGDISSSRRMIKCESPNAFDSLTAATARVCEGTIDLSEDNAATPSTGVAVDNGIATDISLDGIAAVKIWAALTAASTAQCSSGDGGGLFLNRNTINNGWANASTTPDFEATLAIQSNKDNQSTSTLFIFGMTRNSNGSDVSVLPTAGYYFAASSTEANWLAVAQEQLGTIKIVNTGVASTSMTATTTHKFFIHVEPGSGASTNSYYYIDNVLRAKLNVSPGSGSRFTGLGPQITIGCTAGGMGRWMLFSYMRMWADLMPKSLEQ